MRIKMFDLIEGQAVLVEEFVPGQVTRVRLNFASMTFEFCDGLGCTSSPTIYEMVIEDENP